MDKKANGYFLDDENIETKHNQWIQEIVKYSFENIFHQDYSKLAIFKKFLNQKMFITFSVTSLVRLVGVEMASVFCKTNVPTREYTANIQLKCGGKKLIARTTRGKEERIIFYSTILEPHIEYTIETTIRMNFRKPKTNQSSPSRRRGEPPTMVIIFMMASLLRLVGVEMASVLSFGMTDEYPAPFQSFLSAILLDK